MFSMFKWFFSAPGDKCGGWDQFPTFGLKALKWKWQYDWSLTYVGVGKLHWLPLSMRRCASSGSMIICSMSYPAHRMLIGGFCCGKFGTANARMTNTCKLKAQA